MCVIRLEEEMKDAMHEVSSAVLRYFRPQTNTKAENNYETRETNATTLLEEGLIQMISVCISHKSGCPKHVRKYLNVSVNVNVSQYKCVTWHLWFYDSIMF